MTYCKSRMQYGEPHRNEPSSFLDEIPEALKEEKDHTTDQHWGERRTSQGWSPKSQYGWERPTYGGRRNDNNRQSYYGSSSRSSEGEDWRRGFSGSGTYRSSDEPVVKKATARAAQSTFGFDVGDRVMHKKFGEGFVEELSGKGDDTRIRIRFDKVGSKELLLALAIKNMQKV